MTVSHFIIENAFQYEANDESLIPKGCNYDIRNGFWVIEENDVKIPFIQSKNGHKPQTKKCDRETGEDLKGF